MTIGRKLIPVFFVLVLLVAGVGVIGAFFSLEMLSDVGQMLLGQSTEMKTATAISYQVDTICAETSRLLSQEDGRASEEDTALVGKLRDGVEEVRNLTQLMERRYQIDIELSGDNEAWQKCVELCKRLNKETGTFLPLLEEMLVIRQSEGVPEADSFFRVKVEPVLAKAQAIAEELMRAAREKVVEQTRPLSATMRHCAWVGIIVATVGVLGLMIMRYYVNKLVLNPTRKLMRAAVEMREGKLETVGGAVSDNEIGLLAELIGHMAPKLRERHEGEHSGNKTRKKQGVMLFKASRLGAKAGRDETEKAFEARGREDSISGPVPVGEGRRGETDARERLQRRIRQLNCFYGLSKLVERPQISLDEIFQESSELIRSAYEQPELTCVRISFDGIQYKTENFQKSELSQCAPIKLGAENGGAIEVYYLGEKGGDGELPFLKEEREMLDAVAEHLGRVAGGKRTGEKLQLFRNLIDRSNDCIFVMDSQWGRLLDVNDRACESLGYKRQELLEMSVKDIDELVGDDTCWQRHVQELKAKGDIVIEGNYRRKDGSSFTVETSFKLVGHRREEFIIAITRDITDRKRAEENQAKLILELQATNQKVKNINQELTDFAYIVSHDLKAPLRGIKTLADWISGDYADKLDENGKERLKLLLGRVERMHNLIGGVLEYSRVGRTREKKVKVDLNELVAEVIDLIAAPENITIRVEDSLPVVECEKTRMIQVFQNLLSNAVKYIDKPQGQIKVGCVEEGDFWKFSVSDNGPGIEAKYFEKIFRIFQTLASRDEFESTGVGLTVVKKIVELNGGKIWVESEPGMGSTFFFTLPRRTREVKDAELEANIAC